MAVKIIIRIQTLLHSWVHKSLDSLKTDMFSKDFRSSCDTSSERIVS